jgi:hypothetical protein
VPEPIWTRAVFPLTERAFTYTAYAGWLATLDGCAVFPLRDLAAGANGAGRPVVGLRHDVDLDLDGALAMARLEADRGLRASYYVLHTAPYWGRPDLLDRLLELQRLGHEVGWHNDLVTIQVVGRTSPRETLSRELERLRGEGLDIVGTASHGSPWCYRLGYHNDYFFTDLPAPKPGFPNYRSVGGVALETGKLAEFGLLYDAYSISLDDYRSDAFFDDRGRRWHPASLDAAALLPGTRTVVLTHPCHWDASQAAKLRRLGRRVLARARRPRRP